MLPLCHYENDEGSNHGQHQKDSKNYYRQTHDGRRRRPSDPGFWKLLSNLHSVHQMINVPP